MNVIAGSRCARSSEIRVEGRGFGVGYDGRGRMARDIYKIVEL